MRKYMKLFICIGSACIFAMAVTMFLSIRREKQVQKLSEAVFRFHVLANSDSKEDQTLKMCVRESVLSYMKEHLPDTADLDETKTWATDNLTEICRKAKQTVTEQGYDYSVRAMVCRDDFPDKVYGDVTFPAGRYDALRIEIGEGAGHNWWCVLYPNLCFTDAACTVVTEEGKEKLQGVLDEDTYDMVLHPPKWHVRWFFFGK